MEFLEEINYDKLIEKSLKNVVVEALKIAETQGLPGEHHYYITFRTDHPRTNISDQLKAQYPTEMTIVVQHQYRDLKIDANKFSISLSFNSIPQVLEIPFDAITYFADPHAKFGLSFNINEGSEPELDDISFIDETESVTETKRVSNGPAEVISIDAFRKKS